MPEIKPFNGNTVVISDNPEREYVVEVYQGLDIPAANKVSQVNFKVYEFEEYRRYVMGMLGLVG